MNCCNEYGHCTGGHNCPARTTPLVDASRKALAVLSLTGADPALQDELVGAMAEPDCRVAELTAQRDELLAIAETLTRARVRYPEGNSTDIDLLDEALDMAHAALTKHQSTAAPAANTP